jgi:hypothetical protein
MAQINKNYRKLAAGYLFPEIARRANAYVAANPTAKMYRLGIGNTTEALPSAIIEALRNEVDKLAANETYSGYGDEQGNQNLRDALVNYYEEKGVNLKSDEFFISDGAKADAANIQSLFVNESIVAIQDPAYPVYVDSNVIAGRSPAFVPDGEDSLAIESYKISGSGPKGSLFTETTVENSEVKIEALKVGYWTFNATGYNGQGRPIASGETTLYLSKKSTSATLTLDQEVGTGSILLTYLWEATQTNAQSTVNFRLLDSSDKEVTGITPTINFEDGEATFSGNVAAGFYTVMVSIESGEEIVGGLVESLRVIDQTLSEATRTIEIGKLVDLGVITIVDGTVPPFDGEVTLSPTTYDLGDSLTLTLTASEGLSSYSLQWYCEGVPLEGETNSTLVLNSLKGGAIRYDVVISLAPHGAIGSCGILVAIPLTPTLVSQDSE